MINVRCSFRFACLNNYYSSYYTFFSTWLLSVLEKLILQRFPYQVYVNTYTRSSPCFAWNHVNAATFCVQRIWPVKLCLEPYDYVRVISPPNLLQVAKWHARSQCCHLHAILCERWRKGFYVMLVVRGYVCKILSDAPQASGVCQTGNMTISMSRHDINDFRSSDV